MPGKISIEEIKKEYPEFFENFPRELLEAALSEETPLQISAICLENGVADEKKIKDVAYHITSVLLGRLPLDVLSKAIQTNSKIDAEIAEKISLEADRQIFEPVKEALNEIYAPKPPEPQGPPRQDIYHEPLE